MSLTIGDITLYYKTDRNKYITTFLSQYDERIDADLDKIFNVIHSYYETYSIKHSNTCGDNAQYVCKKLIMENVKVGKIIITKWLHNYGKNLLSIEEVYGRIVGSSSYHALVYLEITIDEQKYYIAIETTICKPYKLQFYVGSDFNELKTIVTTRYQCSTFGISFICNEEWYDIDDIDDNPIIGGKKRKTKRKTNKYRKQRKQKPRTKKQFFTYYNSKNARI
jgi:hypothetical protein